MKKKYLSKDADLPEWLKSTSPAPTIKTKSGVKIKAVIEKSPEALLKEGLVLLGVTAEDVESSPKIEHLFKGIGGQAKVFEYLGGSEEPEARALLDLRKRLNNKQAEEVPFEAYCVAAVIPVKKMFGIIASEVADQEGRAKQLMFNANHSRVVEATIDNAMDPLGVADRRMLHQAAGFVPVPKNSITHIHGSQVIDNRLQTTNIAVLPPVEDTVKRLGDRFNDRIMDVKALPAPDIATIESGDAEDGEEEDE